jgi:serine/threonine-protein kinase
LGLVGTSIGRYYLEEFIGAGGTGLVYRAVRRDLGRQVAIKLFYPLGSADVRFRQILKRGFRAQAALNHPNIVSIFDVGEEGVEGRHCFYLVMDYVQGEPLLIWSRGQDRHEDRFGRRLKVAIQIADALRLAHETTYRDEHGFEIRGVLHGDVKPANVLVESGDRARLLDFLLIDIQRIVDPILVRPNILVDDDDDHATSQFFGTPGFMSPEQERQGVLSVSSDIYGLGVTLAHLFLPGTGRPLRRMRRMLQEGTNELPYIVIQMVSKSPSNRPRTMMEVVQSLRAIKDLQV